MLKDESGVWCDDDAQLRTAATTYFSSLFAVTDSAPVLYPISGYFPPIDEAVCSSLGSIPLDQEIKDALFSMAPLKAPGLDGLHAHFYQLHWDIVGASISMMEIWTPFCLVRHGTPVSHLFFTDDLILYAKATYENASCINSVLDLFGSCSGHEANCSTLWRALTVLWPTFTGNLSISMGNGTSLMFWTNPWLSELGPLIYFALPWEPIVLDLHVSDMVTPEGTWDWDTLHTLVAPPVIDAILHIVPPNSRMGHDRFCCYGNVVVIESSLANRLDRVL
ncbi:hypothetical protein V6N11_051106 [Hibiscus sabdariffa]|uniref:Reverse transcriptase zinc-binding domain-containing protein n=1 Tax=Hibiscus sabdariffa TaxID=183260 RepID=A0ABR2R2V0_9ROSI